MQRFLDPTTHCGSEPRGTTPYAAAYYLRATGYVGETTWAPSFVYVLRVGPRFPREFGQIALEAIQALLPVAAVLLDPLGQFAESPRLEPKGSPLRITPAAYELSAFEHIQVPRDCRQADVEGSCEFRDERSPRALGKHSPTGGVSQGGEVALSGSVFI